MGGIRISTFPAEFKLGDDQPAAEVWAKSTDDPWRQRTERLLAELEADVRGRGRSAPEPKTSEDRRVAQLKERP